MSKTKLESKKMYFLFDFDGLIANTEILYAEAWAENLENNSTELYHSIAKGLREEQAVALLRPYLKDPELTDRQILESKNRSFEFLLDKKRHSILFPFVAELIDLIAHHYEVYIVSNSEESIVRRTLADTSILKNISGFFCWSSSILAKPNPALYLKALSSLKISPQQAIAIEDSESGLMAATAANIPVICVSSIAPELKNIRSPILHFESAQEVFKLLSTNFEVFSDYRFSPHKLINFLNCSR